MPFVSGDKLLVFQTDFGREEGTVAQMEGVALGVDPELRIREITHQITPFNIWEASYRLFQTLASWPRGTVFVSVVDPGVGTSRKSVVAHTKSDHFIVTPDNGSLTHVFAGIGIDAVCEIDETVNRVPGSEESQTFHGRDVYGYTGARLAAGVIDYPGVGPERSVEDIVVFPVESPSLIDGKVEGIIEIHDVHFGNVWTNIPSHFVRDAGMAPQVDVLVTIREKGRELYRALLPYCESFGAVAPGEDLVYDNELLYLALSVNQGNFAKTHNIGFGPSWTISLIKHV